MRWSIKNGQWISHDNAQKTYKQVNNLWILAPGFWEKPPIFKELFVITVVYKGAPNNNCRK
jgi:hypothetical protein